jgi:hypothetical protein
MRTHRDTRRERLGRRARTRRAASAYEHWVGSEGLSFRGRDDAERLGDVVKFHWEAVAEDGEVFGVGLNFLASPRTAGSSATTRSSSLGGWAPLYSESRKGVSATTASTPAFAWTRASHRRAADARIERSAGVSRGEATLPQFDSKQEPGAKPRPATI